MLSINEILKNTPEQLIVLSEILIFICSISSNKNEYLQKVAEFDNTLCSFFLSVIEKYILIENEELNQSRSLMMNRSNFNLRAEKADKQNLIDIIRENENRIYNMKGQIEAIEKQKKVLEQKLKDKENELEIYNKNSSNSNQIQEQLINTAINQVELKNKLAEKDVEIQQLQKEKELIINANKEKMKKLREEMDVLNDKVYDYNELKSKYEKVNSKYKDLKEKNILEKDEQVNKDGLITEKNNTISILTKEKEALNALVQKLNDEIITIKKKNSKNEVEIQKLDIVINDLKNELEQERNKNFELQKEKIDVSNIGPGGGFTMGDVLEESTLKRYDSNISYFMTPKNIKGFIYDETALKETQAQKDLVKEKESIKEKEKEFEKVKEELKKENQTIQTEKEKIQKEKDKLENKLEKVEIDKKKLSLELDRRKNEVGHLENENKALNEKIKNFAKNKSMEIDKLKKDLKAKTSLVESLSKDKKNIQNEVTRLQKELETNNNNNSTNTNKEVNPLTGSVSDAEVLALKNEIQNLNLQSIQKDQEIKKLKDEVADAKNEAELYAQGDIESKLADLDFYKKSFEEQKRRVNHEHEIISDSLYKLALHFMSIKDSLQKKMK